MEQKDSARAVKFGTEVIVEVQGTDEYGDVDVISYQFAAEDDGRVLTPRNRWPVNIARSFAPRLRTTNTNGSPAIE